MEGERPSEEQGGTSTVGVAEAWSRGCASDEETSPMRS